MKEAKANLTNKKHMLEFAHVNTRITSVNT